MPESIVAEIMPTDPDDEYLLAAIWFELRQKMASLPSSMPVVVQEVPAEAE